jgi:glycolate oxidase
VIPSWAILYRRTQPVSPLHLAAWVGAKIIDNMNPSTVKNLINILGPDGYSDSLIDLISYSYDGSSHRDRPQAAVWPVSAEQVSQVLKLANRDGFAVVPRGAGTSMCGGAVPAKGGVVMDLGRMNQIIDIRIGDRLAVVQPGVVYADLQSQLDPHGFFFPPDPASGKVCTLGGNVATNAGGIRGAKYGVTRDYVLALEVVLPDGRITKMGTTCMKSSSGLDITRLMVGSEGILGVITEITLKINPKPRAFETCQASFKDLATAGEVVSQVMHSGVLPSVMEIMDAATIKVLRERGGMELPEAEALILVETDGFTSAEARHQLDVVLNIFKEHEAVSIQVAKSQEEAARLWKARKAAGSTAAQLRPNNVAEDIAVPISQLPKLLGAIGEKVPQI